MILSHKHKFIFLKTKKTAGTSIEIALSKICGEEDIITPISNKDEITRKELGYRGPQNCLVPFQRYNSLDLFRCLRYQKRVEFYNHISAEEVKRYVGEEVWGNYYKFTFDRNPYDKVVSLYYYYGGDSTYESFQEFIDSGAISRLNSFDQYSINGIVAVDDIYRFESLSKAIDQINLKLKLKEPIEMPSKRAKGGMRKIKNYRELIDEHARKQIDLVHAREFELLKYTY